jgi:hypothetical protein
LFASLTTERDESKPEFTFISPLSAKQQLSISSCLQAPWLARITRRLAHKKVFPREFWELPKISNKEREHFENGSDGSRHWNQIVWKENLERTDFDADHSSATSKMRKNERNNKMLLRTRNQHWVNIGSGKSSKPTGKYKLVQPQEQVQKGGMGPVVNNSPKENRQDEETIVLTAITTQQGIVNSDSSKKGTGTKAQRSLFKRWSSRKKLQQQQEDENAKLLQQQSNDKDPARQSSKLKASSSRDSSVWTNATRDSSSKQGGGGEGSTGIWTYRSRDALSMSKVRSSHSKDAIKRSRSKGDSSSSIAAASSKSNHHHNKSRHEVSSRSSMEQWKKNNNDSIWIGRGKDALNKSHVVVRSRSRSSRDNAVKSSKSKDSSIASSSSNPSRTNKDKLLTKNEAERKNDNVDEDDEDEDVAHSSHLLIVQKRKSAWIRNMKYFQAQQQQQQQQQLASSKLDAVDSRCDHAGESCRKNQQDNHEGQRDVAEQQRTSSEELGIYALKTKNKSSPSSRSTPAYNIPGNENNNTSTQASPLTKEDEAGKTTSDYHNFDGVHGIALAMAAAMDGFQQSSNYTLDCTSMTTNLPAVNVAKEQVTRLYYQVATASSRGTPGNNEDDDADIAAASEADRCMTIPLLADIKEHVGNFQWTNDFVSLAHGGETKSCDDGHTGTTCATAIMPTETSSYYPSHQSVPPCTTTSPIVDIIHDAMCKKDYNVETRTAATHYKSAGGSEMTTMIGADGSLYQVQVLRRLATEEAKKLRTMSATPSLFSQAPRSMASSPVGAPCSMRDQAELDETTTPDKHDDYDDDDNDTNEDVGMVSAKQQDEAQQEPRKQQELI